MSFRRMLPFLILNVFVSAAVVLTILFWWNSREIEPAAGSSLQSPLLDPTAIAQLSPTVDPNAPPPPTDTPAPTPTPERSIYIVQPGDTMGKISTIFGVAIDDIMRANGLSDPNFLQVGQELIIPVESFAEPEPTAAPTEPSGLAPTPIPTEPLAGGTVIIEIREVVAPGDLPNEAVSIVNTGSRPVALQGWKLIDQQGFEYKFGQVTLFGDGAGILVHTEVGPSTPLDLYWGLETAVWAAGETVRLLDAEGTEQARYTIP